MNKPVVTAENGMLMRIKLSIMTTERIPLSSKCPTPLEKEMRKQMYEPVGTATMMAAPLLVTMESKKNSKSLSLIMTKTLMMVQQGHQSQTGGTQWL